MIKNPYILAAIPFTLVLLLYSIKWGTILVPLTPMLVNFLVIFIFLLFFIGFIMNNSFKKKTMEDDGYERNRNSASSKYIVMIILVLTLIEGIYFRGFPITGAISYADFGIPGIHPVILTFNGYMLVKFFYEWGLEFKNKIKRTKGSLVIWLILPFIVEINRGMLIMILLSGIIAFIIASEVKITLIKTLKLIIFGLVSIYMFGLAGNYRTNFAFSGKERFLNSYYIMSLGGAQNNSVESLLDPFYWGYIYISSSMANLQSTILQVPDNITQNSLLKLFIVQFSPDFISKRIYPNAIDTLGSRVNSEFNTGTVFNSAYYLYGWAGITITAIVILLLPLLLHIVLKNKEKKYYVIGFSFLGCMYVFLTFDNMLGFTGLTLPIIYAIVGAYINVLRNKIK